MNTRSRPVKRRQPQKGALGWRACVTHEMADTIARTYIDRCRADFKPDDYRVLTQKEQGRTVHYPVIIVHDPKVRDMHRRSGFRVVGH